MIRAILRIGIIGAATAGTLEWVLRRQAGGAPPAAIATSVVIDAPIERVWRALADIEGQPRWMHDMKAVRMTTPTPTRVGSRGEATVRMFGIAVTDPVTVTAFDPPRIAAIG